MPLRIIVALFCLLQWVAKSAPAVSPEPVGMLFRNWNTRDGLPHNRISSVIRTQDGFIWLATDAGAVRFDGVDFKVFGVPEGLKSPVVVSLYETNGELWIGTVGGGLSVMRGGKIEKTYGVADGLPSAWILDIGQDAGGSLVVSTLGGTARFENGGFKLPPRPGKPVIILPIVRDASGTPWGKAWGFLWSWKDDQWQRPEGGPVTPSALCADHQGQIWVYGDQRLWCNRLGTWRSYELPAGFNGLANSMAAAPDGTIWIAFHRRGLCGFRDGRFITPVPSQGYTQDLVETITVTADDQIWLTTAEGLFSMAGQRLTVSTIHDPPSSRVANDIGGLLECIPGQFIVASQGNGFYLWKGGTTSRLDPSPLLREGVYGNALHRRPDGSIWLAASTGAFRWESGVPLEQIPVPDKKKAAVWAFAESPEGLLIGTGQGSLFIYKSGAAEPVEDYPGKESPIKILLTEKDGTLWVGTRGNGLFRRKDGVWTRFGRESGLLSEIIRTVYLDPRDRLWIGTDGGGLSYLSDGRFISVTTQNGLPNDSISQILLDHGGRLWLGTHRGMAILSSEALDAIVGGDPGQLHPIWINRADGLPTEEFTIVPPFRTSAGSYAFATSRGWLSLFPTDFQPDETRPIVYIEQVFFNGANIPFSRDKVMLGPGTEQLGFQFTGLYVKDAERLKFRYRLSGLENHWTLSSGRRFVEYRNVAPGSYRFELEASIGNGLWSRQPATLDVVLKPYFWQRIWFKIAIGLVALALCGLLVRWNERRKAERRIAIFEKRQAVDNERSRIARDLHDDVGASLTQVALQSQLVERNMNRRPEHALELLKEIFRTARGMTRALDEIVWAVNPTQDTLEGFISFLGTFVQEYANGAELQSRLDLPETIPVLKMPPTVRHHLYLASKEILHNIVKHSHATKVHLHMRLEEGQFVITISDNGRGFDDSPGAAGADGLINLKNRLESLNGSCVRHSQSGHGTSIEMRIPMNWEES